MRSISYPGDSAIFDRAVQEVDHDEFADHASTQKLRDELSSCCESEAELELALMLANGESIRYIGEGVNVHASTVSRRGRGLFEKLRRGILGQMIHDNLRRDGWVAIDPSNAFKIHWCVNGFLVSLPGNIEQLCGLASVEAIAMWLEKIGLSQLAENPELRQRFVFAETLEDHTNLSLCRFVVQQMEAERFARHYGRLSIFHIASRRHICV